MTIGPTAQATQTILVESRVDPREDPAHNLVRDMMPTKVMTLEPATPLKEIIAAVIGLVAVGLGVAALTATCEALLAAFFGAHHRALGPALAALLVTAVTQGRFGVRDLRPGALPSVGLTVGSVRPDP